MDTGWIKLWRKIEEWEWHRDVNTFRLFIHLLMKATHKPMRFMGFEINRGQCVIGRYQTSLDTGISEQSIRTSLERLKSTNEITIKSTSKFSIVTLLNYERYQGGDDEINQENNQQSNHHLTSIQPASNHKQEHKNIRTKELNTSEASPDLLKQEPKEKDPFRVDLKDWACEKLTQGAKHKMFNNCVQLFRHRGWSTNADFIKRILKTVTESVNGKDVRNYYVYFGKALHNYCNEQADAISNASKRIVKKETERNPSRICVSVK